MHAGGCGAGRYRASAASKQLGRTAQRACLVYALVILYAPKEEKGHCDSHTCLHGPSLSEKEVCVRFTMSRKNHAWFSSVLKINIDNRVVSYTVLYPAFNVHGKTPRKSMPNTTHIEAKVSS